MASRKDPFFVVGSRDAVCIDRLLLCASYHNRAFRVAYFFLSRRRSPMKGCFYKSDVAYFGLGGTDEEMASPSEGQKMRRELHRTLLLPLCGCLSCSRMFYACSFCAF